MLKTRLLTAACCALTAAPAAPVWAQTENFPARPVRLIVPFAPGGSVDLISRMVGAKLAETLGQQVVVDNRAGASGNIGSELVARAAPDGYTLLVNTTPFVVNTHLMGKVPYDVLNDFVPVSLLSSSPSITRAAGRAWWRRRAARWWRPSPTSRRPRLT